MRGARAAAVVAGPLPASASRSVHVDRWRSVLMALMLGAPLTYALGESVLGSAIEAPGFISQAEISIGSAQAGTVAEVYVQPLQEVTAGDPIARLADEHLQERALQLRDRLQEQAGAGEALGVPVAAGARPDHEGQLAKVDGELEALLVRAPKSGRISRVDVIVGDRLAAGRRVASLVPSAEEVHVDAWIPQRYSTHAAPGEKAVVMFPDGARRSARVVAVPPTTAHRLPTLLAGGYGQRQPGVLVRMDFVDDGRPARRLLTDGARVRVLFSRKDSPGVMARLQRWLTGGADSNIQGS